MDITQLLVNGGVVMAVVGLLYKINNRRLDKLENGKVGKEVHEIQYEGLKENIQIVHKRIDVAIQHSKDNREILNLIQTSMARIETVLEVDID